MYNFFTLRFLNAQMPFEKPDHFVIRLLQFRNTTAISGAPVIEVILF